MILVTGGTGLLGTHLLFYLVSQGEKVRALKRETSNIDRVKTIFAFFSSKYNSLFDKIEWVDGDLNDIYSLNDALKGVSYVYHCAAHVSFQRKDRDTLFKTNVEGTRNLVNACLDAPIEKLCFISSTSALGTPEVNDTFVTEKTPWHPETKHTNYALSKFHAELEVWRGIAEGLNAVIINPSIILGAGFWNKGSSRLFSSVARGLQYYTKGVTGYVDVRDVVKVAIALMQSDISGERFIVNSENQSYEYMFKTIAKHLNLKAPNKYASPRMTWFVCAFLNIQGLWGREVCLSKEIANIAHDVQHYDNAKIKEAIGFEFRPVEVSIAHIAEIYKMWI